MLKSGEERWMLALSVLISAVLLLFFSRSSPLYPTNNWGEANAFFTVGRGMLAGKVPYKDLALGAGPMIYALHALAACISSGSFIGVWLLEVLFFSGVIFAAWDIAAEISGKGVLSMICTALLALLLVSSRAFVYGDTVEEFALPLQMFALCDLLLYLKDPERDMPVLRMVLHGFMAGCVFWMKYTLIGTHLAFIAVIAIEAMVRERRLKGAICSCLEFAAGMLLASAPWAVYLGLNGALRELADVYFDLDLENLVYDFAPVKDALAGLASGALNNPACALVLLCGAGYLLYRLVHRRWTAGCTAVSAAFACTAVVAYMIEGRYRFSPMVVGVFLLLCAGPLVLLLCYAWRQRRVYAALISCAALACAGYACVENESLPFIGYPRDKLPQEIFARYMEAYGGGTVLTYHIPDGGFYLAVDTLPGAPGFAKSDAYGYEGVWEKQDDAIRSAMPEWIISRSSYAPEGMYVRVLTASSPYDISTTGKTNHLYYLYHRMEK